jgi:aspartate-semialdehyde dehydrogenase
MPANYRIAIVGAASLRGKELNEALGESPFAAADFVLMDDQEAIGQLEAVGDEVTFIQQITAASFTHADFTFFTGSAELTRKHWETAVRAGSAIIDLSGALDTEKDAVVLAPWVQESVKPLNLQTPAAVPAHPAALTLALLLGQIRQASAVRSAFATVLEPASEYGRGAMDELHQQTVSLLSFQSPRLARKARLICRRPRRVCGATMRCWPQAGCLRSPFSSCMRRSSMGIRCPSASISNEP